MSPSAVQFSSEKTSSESVYSVPAKSFVIGEYAVLSESPALVAAFGPRFRLSSGKGRATLFHAASPAGRLLARARRAEPGGHSFHFEDPFGGEGGFGASTAQFALAYGALARQEGWEPTAAAARRFYRELMADEALPPSGADLIAQWNGGVVRFDPRSEKAEPCFSALDWRDLLVFSAASQPGRKVPTHEHLAQLARSGAASSGGGGLPGELSRALQPVLDRALKLESAETLGRAMKEYAQILAKAGLELEAARADREAMCLLPGVLGAKGTGALLADGLLVLLEPGASSRAAVIGAAKARGLRLVADGLGSVAEAGFTAGASA